MFLTPEAEPFFGGTYFPARDGDRMAGARVLREFEFEAVDEFADRRDESRIEAFFQVIPFLACKARLMQRNGARAADRADGLDNARGERRLCVRRVHRL